MKLSPREKDKLLVSMAAMVARNRKQRGVKLNYPEAIALISDFVVEGARDGRAVRGPGGNTTLSLRRSKERTTDAAKKSRQRRSSPL